MIFSSSAIITLRAGAPLAVAIAMAVATALPAALQVFDLFFISSCLNLAFLSMAAVFVLAFNLITAVPASNFYYIKSKINLFCLAVMLDGTWIVVDK